MPRSARTGRRVVTGDTIGLARVWDAATGELISQALPHARWLYSAVFSPDGRRVVTASEDHNRAGLGRSRPAGRPSVEACSGGEVRRVQPDGRLVVTASEDRTARLWDAATGQPFGPPLPHGDRVIRAVFSPDGKYVSTGSYDRTARVWEVATGRLVSTTAKHHNSVQYASFSPTVAIW